MVSLINEVADMGKIILYNEQKIREHKARYIGALNFPLPAELLSEPIKRAYLQSRANLNLAVNLNSLHITLGFHPSERLLKDTQMQEIAHLYMELIGFTNQPYLIYRHLDTDHPHLHIVSTPMRSDGTRIRMHRIGIKKSKPAQLLIEKKYGLRSAFTSSKAAQSISEEIEKATQDRPYYSVKKHIEERVAELLNSKKFSGFEAFKRDLARNGIGVYKRKTTPKSNKPAGLSYALLGSDGRSSSSAIPASSLSGRPTLTRLEKLFSPSQEVLLAEEKLEQIQANSQLSYPVKNSHGPDEKKQGISVKNKRIHRPKI